MKRNVERLSIDALQGECATSAGSSARTIFQALSDQSVLPEERTVPRLRDEGMLLLGAGFETTARVVTIGAFYLYKNDYVLQSLRKELKQVMPTPTHKVSWTQLEKLPYLTAVVNESLRLAHSTIIRSPRVAPNRTLQYENYTIPPGTPVSQSIYFVHADPSVFPNPHEFDPERWMQPSQSAERLSRFLVPFSMGSRMCIGMSLSYCEIYLMLAALVRRFNLKHETTHEDIRITRDLIIRFPDTETLQNYKGKFIVPVGKVEAPNAVIEDDRQVKGIWVNTTEELNKQLVAENLRPLRVWKLSNIQNSGQHIVIVDKD